MREEQILKYKFTLFNLSVFLLFLLDLSFSLFSGIFLFSVSLNIFFEYIYFLNIYIFYTMFCKVGNKL